MESIKIKRLETDIKRALSEVLHVDIKNLKNSALITITDVELTSDLSYLTIYVHFANATDGTQEKHLEELKRKSTAIRTALAKRVHMRKMPELIFKVDTSLANADRIEELLKEAKAKDAKNKTNTVEDAEDKE